MTPIAATPSGPQWTIDWTRVVNEFPWFAALAGVEQSPQHHREGDVQTHVQMVCEALVATTAWRQLPTTQREDLFAAALLHDIAKPACFRREDGGRITARGHARRGAIMARRILWEFGVDPERRERICGLVRHHMLPFHLLDRADAERDALRAAEVVPWQLLAMHGEADIRGRECDDKDSLLAQIELAREFVAERQCFTTPYAFSSDHARFLYFRGDRTHPGADAWLPETGTVTILSGLPGAGKDTWIQQHSGGQPMVSLDQLRRELGVDPTDNQGTVVQEARERARQHLRAKRDFIWNATHVSRQVRGQTVALCAQYGARIRIVYVESTADCLFDQNAARADAVPRKAIDKLLTRWDPPDRTEAHEVQWVCP